MSVKVKDIMGVMEKIAPYLIVLGTVAAFLAVGYMERAL